MRGFLDVRTTDTELLFLFNEVLGLALRFRGAVALALALRFRGVVALALGFRERTVLGLSRMRNVTSEADLPLAT